MTDGIKHDGGKVQPALVLETMARALQAVCEVGTFGAQKYSADNWLQVPDALSRYRNAKHRHMLAAAMGETRDSESGLLHAAHEAWNALAVLELKLREQSGDVTRAVEPSAWGKGERRMEIIGRNANEGEHYDAMVLPEGVNPSERVNQVAIEVTKRGELAGYLLIDGRIAGRFKPEPKSVPGTYRRNPEHPSVWVR